MDRTFHQLFVLFDHVLFFGCKYRDNEITISIDQTRDIIREKKWETK